MKKPVCRCMPVFYISDTHRTPILALKYVACVHGINGIEKMYWKEYNRITDLTQIYINIEEVCFEEVV